MYILDGEVTMTIEDETRTLRAGDTVVVNRGLEHELRSATGVTFMEALAPVRSTTSPTASATSCWAPTAAPRTSSAEARPPTKESPRRWPMS